MTSPRIRFSFLLLPFCVSCLSLNYPIDPNQTSSANARAESSALEELLPQTEVALSWSDLTRLAREHRQRGELEEAGERLDQAALQVELLPPTHARRRTVFGMRARLAIALAEAGEIEAADELADTLFAEADTAPDLGGAALISLALSVADRRPQESQLRLLRIALTTAQAGTTSRSRMKLALRVAETAYAEKDLEVARRAIDQAVLDAEHTGPSRRARIASLELFKSRIALAQSDLETAESSAIRANRLFDQISASPSERGIAEATLAEILAEKGDIDKALVIARGAYARIDGATPLEAHAERVILVAQARVRRSVGDSASARQHYERALEIAGLDTAADKDLVRRITQELQDLDRSTTSSSSEAPIEP